MKKLNNKIEIDSHLGITKLSINGEDISHSVSGYKLEQHAGEIPKLIIDIVPFDKDLIVKLDKCEIEANNESNN